jgi:hypothetical protein
VAVLRNTAEGRMPSPCAEEVAPPSPEQAAAVARRASGWRVLGRSWLGRVRKRNTARGPPRLVR